MVNLDLILTWNAVELHLFSHNFYWGLSILTKLGDIKCKEALIIQIYRF